MLLILINKSVTDCQKTLNYFVIIFKVRSKIFFPSIFRTSWYIKI